MRTGESIGGKNVPNHESEFKNEAARNMEPEERKHHDEDQDADADQNANEGQSLSEQDSDLSGVTRRSIIRAGWAVPLVVALSIPDVSLAGGWKKKRHGDHHQSPGYHDGGDDDGGHGDWGDGGHGDLGDGDWDDWDGGDWWDDFHDKLKDWRRKIFG